MKKQERTKATTNSAPSAANDFHVYVKPSTGDWLRRQINRDEPSVPAVIRAIVEAAQRRAEGNNRG